MTRMRLTWFCAALTLMVLASRAETLPGFPARPSATATNIIPPPLPDTPSPVAFFRQLLVMTARERNQALTNRTPAARERIMVKIREYLALDPNERELRLQATELRWYLTPLLRLPATEREPALSRVPEELRGLVQSRLMHWDILPPSLKQNLLANEKTLQYFAQVQTNNPVALTAEQQRLSEQFNRFFELTSKEKQQTLGKLSEPERAAMDKTLKTFEKLPPQQRMLCIRNYAKFAGMNPAERTEFLKNAEQWSKMTPAERQSWRNLVAQVPQMPPVPPPVIPANLIPPSVIKTPRPSVATN